ncbi:MAG: hemerythrin domain-containing protein [Actinomycetes bacterium]
MHTEFPVSELIRDDHREMRRLFGELQNPRLRPLAAPTLLALLAAHSRAEETEVYPKLRHEAGDAVAHSQHEHAEADRLVERLVKHNLNEDEFEHTLKSLVEAVNHHIEEEENTVLTEADKLPASEQRVLGSAFTEARSKILTSIADPLTRTQLEQQARNEGLQSTRSMTRDDLVGAVTEDPS